MFKNYFRVALRNLKKHKGFSFINIMGLSVGLTCCILIGLYINEELSYDKFHKDSDNIYRFTREFISADGSTSLHLSSLAPAFSPLLRNEYTNEIDKIGRYVTFSGTVTYEDKIFNEANFGFADPEIVEILTFDVVEGDLKEALSQPGSVVISETMARKYFGSADPMGKTIKYGTQTDLIVRGIYRDLPDNSSVQLDMMGDFSVVETFFGGRERVLRNFGSNSFKTIFTLTESGRINEIERRLEDFLIASIGANAPSFTALHIQKFTDVHLKSSLDDEQGLNSDITYVYIFASIAGLILAIACINYMNLATARSASRAKEVGMRKVFGAAKGNLINQFLVESVILVLMAVVIAVGITALILPFFREFTGLVLDFNLIDNWNLIVVILGFALVVGILAGSYPAFYLSSFRPLRVLKGKLTSGAKSGGMRKVLVVFQFSISVILIVSTIVVFQQLNYIQNKNLGYDKDQMMILGVSNQIGAQYETFKNEVLNITGVKSIGGSSRVPSGQLLDSQGAQAEVDGEMAPTPVTIKVLSVDPDFIPTYQMELVGGRNFTDDFSRDSASFILNEKSVKVIGWSSAAEAVGKPMVYSGVRGRVIGVVKDFLFESLQSDVSPLVLVNRPNSMRSLSIKIEGANLRSSVSQIEDLYAKFSPNSPIRYNFLDDRFDSLYSSETQRSQLFTIFSGLAIFLACLGLFGLTSFTVAQRGKEISIRKVLGASVNQIVGILSKEFIILITVSMVLAFPVAWYFMGDWLDSYAYRIDLSWTPFAIATAIIGSIALITISMQTFKAAVSNPSDRLRDE